MVIHHCWLLQWHEVSLSEAIGIGVLTLGESLTLVNLIHTS